MFYFYRNVEYKHSKLGTILATLGTAMAIGAAAGMALLYVGNKIGKKATEDHAKKEMQERSRQLKEMQERSRYRD